MTILHPHQAVFQLFHYSNLSRSTRNNVYSSTNLGSVTYQILLHQNVRFVVAVLVMELLVDPSSISSTESYCHCFHHVSILLLLLFKLLLNFSLNRRYQGSGRGCQWCRRSRQRIHGLGSWLNWRWWRHFLLYSGWFFNSNPLLRYGYFHRMSIIDDQG